MQMHVERGVGEVEVVEDAYSIRKQGVGICCHHHCMSDSVLAIHLEIAPARN
jgi:hypothetical protein